MRVLKRGSSRLKATTLSQKLKDLGFDPKAVDGKFGPSTHAAVIAFQKAKGLTTDGKVGPNTLAALNSNGNAASVSDSTTVADTTNASVALTALLLTDNDYAQAAELL